MFPPQTFSSLSSYILPLTLALSFDGKWMPSPVFPRAPYTRGQPGCLTPLRGKEVELVNEAVTFPYLFIGKEWQRKRSTQKSGKVNKVSLSCYPVCPFKEKLERHFERASKIVVVDLSQMKRMRTTFCLPATDYLVFDHWVLVLTLLAATFSTSILENVKQQ